MIINKCHHITWSEWTFLAQSYQHQHTHMAAVCQKKSVGNEYFVVCVCALVVRCQCLGRWGRNLSTFFGTFSIKVIAEVAKCYIFLLQSPLSTSSEVTNHKILIGFGYGLWSREITNALTTLISDTSHWTMLLH